MIFRGFLMSFDVPASFCDWYCFGLLHRIPMLRSRLGAMDAIDCLQKTNMAMYFASNSTSIVNNIAST